MDSDIRFDLFRNAKLGVLYSGTIGKAHQFEEFIILARMLRERNSSVSFCFAGRGNCYTDLQNMVSEQDRNISFAGFIEEAKLPLRLAAADMHMISLRQGWEGIVVPSKFFGSLASGRPLLYCGTPDSCIAELIQEQELGFIVEMDTVKDVADILEELSYDHEKLQRLQERCFAFYKTQFAKNIQWMKWDRVLREYITSQN
jgi:glycosyltransferase involved in cell wall biosynthesis